MKKFYDMLKQGERRHRLRQRPEPRKRVRIIYGTIGVFLLFCFWFIGIFLYIQITGQVQFKGFFPHNAITRMVFLFGESGFWVSVVTSLLRFFLSILIAAVIGIPVGVLMGIYLPVRLLASPPFQFIRMVSPISWMPIATVFLPGFEEAVVFIIAIATLWPVLLSTADAVMSVEVGWLQMVRNQGATETQLLFKVILPAALPRIIASLRLAVGVAWIVLVPAELLGTASGLGYLINEARNTLEYDTLMAVILVIGGLGFGIDSLFSWFKRRADWMHRI